MNAHHSSRQLHTGQIHTHEETAVFLYNFEQNFERERNAFRRLPPDLLAVHKGQFVAVSGGKIVDQDWDEMSLAKRVARMPQDKFILIKRINEI
ncbi:MAG TPA: hypothetical protein VMD27_07465 [Candidatus Aquilonibacter sp.]|nr:hypothetical protein [Candidatus Aquilonibacter sp.]